MKLDAKKISAGLHDGEIVWIFDFRYNNNDLNNSKPIRNVKPTKVLIFSNDKNTVSNKSIYYSNSHFVEYDKKGNPNLKKVIGLYDNTGYRGHTGTAINVFDNELECKNNYKIQCEYIISIMKEFLFKKNQFINQKILAIQDSINQY